MDCRPTARACDRWVRAALLLAAGLLTANAAPAQEQPRDRPLLQIEAGMHTAPIQQMRLDATRNRLVSVSTDRTARVWQLPQLRLVQTLRMPAAPGFEGELHAIAISADGRWLAVGGTTGFRWLGSGCVHVYALDTLRLARSYCGWPDIVQTLAYSRDGRWLAVGLGGRHGLRILRADDGTEVARDTEYGGAVRYAEFSAQDRLATSAGDGYLRLYDPTLKLVGRRRLGESTQMGGVRFSPDGRRMAVGIADRPQAFIVDTATLSTIAQRGVDDPRQRDLCCVGFSIDGRWLYLNGSHDGPGPTPLYRLGGAGTGAIEVLPVGEGRFTNMAPLPDGALAYATDRPLLAVLDANGRPRTGRDGRPLVARPAIGDFRAAAGAFAASDDGSVLRVPMRAGGADALLFSVAALQPLAQAPPRLRLQPAQLEGASPVLGTDDSPAPTLGGRRLALELNERALCHAFAPGGRDLVVGTLWSVRRFAADGTPAWRAEANAPVTNVLVTRDSRFVIATIADGTVRWLAFADGHEVASLYLHPNRVDWVLWRPDGLYASSDEGDSFVGWLVSRGARQAPDYFSAVQFERVFYRQDLDVPGLRSAATTTAEGAASIDRLAEIAPPRVHLSGSAVRPLPSGAVEASLEVDAERLGSPMGELVVYVNGLPVTPAIERPLKGADRERMRRRFTLALTQPDNVVRVEVPGMSTMGMAELWLPGPASPVPATRPGDLYVVAVGVNRFPGIGPGSGLKDPTLRFAAADAVQVARHLAATQGAIYRRVVARVLADEGGDGLPDKASVRDALNGLRQAGPDDTVVVFLASHGFSDRAGNYYFLPRDARSADILAVLKGADTAAAPPASLLAWQEIFDALRQAAGRRVLVVDTCQARNLAAEKMSHTLRKRSAASLFALMLASRGDEESQELQARGHGVFTFGVLQALQGLGGADADGGIRLDRVFEHAKHIVEQQRPDRSKPQTPQLLAPARLGDVPLAQVAAGPAR